MAAPVAGEKTATRAGLWTGSGVPTGAHARRSVAVAAADTGMRRLVETPTSPRGGFMSVAVAPAVGMKTSVRATDVAIGVNRPRMLFHS